ncbi:MAG: T9SS type A sorting domain-containing protein, partial [Candidatus Zixiibacteriota bacterium]
YCFTPVAGINQLTLICVDSCVAADTCETFVYVELNSPPVATCPGNDTLLVCDTSEICIASFSASDPDNNLDTIYVFGGTLSGDTVCFTPVEGDNSLTLVAVDSCGDADTCQTVIHIDFNLAPFVFHDTDFITYPPFICEPDTICVPYWVVDADNNVILEELLEGVGIIDTVNNLVCFWADTTGIYHFVIQVTDSCNVTDVDTMDLSITLNSPPTATCSGDDTLFVCDLSDICISGFSASDPDNNLQSITVTGGTLSGDTVCFTPVAGNNAITLIATDSCGAADTCQTNIYVVLNSSPAANCPGDTTIEYCLNPPAEVCIPGFTCSDPDGNLASCVSSLGTLSGDTVCFAPSGPGIYQIILTATDACQASAQCTVNVGLVDTCVEECPIEVVIENKEAAHLGGHAQVCVWVSQVFAKMGGFDFLIAYDVSALILTSVIEGELYDPYPPGCEWEYFQYRFGPFGNCGNQCPSGLVRVIGMAEINDGPAHPACFKLPTPFTLFCLDFLVTNDQTFECNFVPIHFFWIDCGDNVISSKDGDTLWVSDHVYIKGGGPQSPDTIYGPPPNEEYMYIEITDMYSGFPTDSGVQAECLVDPDSGGPKEPPVQCIDFYGGGIDIVCVEDLDDRGDINLNGVKNEIADAVMFTNYFIYGLGVFPDCPGCQAAAIAATDVNADGLTLSVADLVYLIRIITGDAQLYPKLATVEANFTNDGGVLSIDAEMGAAYVVVQGDVTPELLADQMEIKYAYDAEANVTRVLVYSLEGHGFSGEFLNANGNVVSIEMGSYEGAVVKLTNIPANFALHQNYPNPFNPTTTISFNLPVATDYTLTIYNVAGQQVAVFSDRAEAGVVEIEWDASTMASGVYFYKLTAGDFSDTKKMVLIK